MQNQIRRPVDRLREQSFDLAAEIVDRHYAASPELATRYGSEGRRRCLEDAQYHLRYLAEAVDANSPVLFADYIDWARVVLNGRNVPTDDLKNNLSVLRDTLAERFTEAEYDKIVPAIDAGSAQLVQHEAPGSPSQSAGTNRQLALNYLDHLLEGKRQQAVQLIHDAIDGGLSIKQVYLDVFQPVQYEIGWLWQLNRISVAQEHYATAVTQLIMSQLYAKTLSGAKNGRVIVCACVGGDSHEIGSRMVADLFELEGWDSYYFGASTPAAAIAEQTKDRKADLVALSATMTYYLPQVRQTIAAVRNCCAAKIVVGGRPFNLEPTLWEQVGADGFARDAGAAVDVADRILALGGAR